MLGIPSTVPARVRLPASQARIRSGSQYTTRSLTRYGLWVMGMSLAVAALGSLRGDVWMYFVALNGLAAIAVNWVTVPRLHQLEMEMVLPAVEVLGQPTFAQLVARSGSRPAARQHIDVYAFGDAPGTRPGALPRAAHAVLEPMDSGRTQALDLLLHPFVRGRHDGHVVWRWTSAPFGLVRRAATTATSPKYRTISSGVRFSRVSLTAKPGDGDSRAMRIGRDGVDVHALRPWSAGDGSAIHWRSTARRNAPHVVDRESPSSPSLTVVVGPAPSVNAVDAVVARAAGYARAATLEGARVQIVAGDGDVEFGSSDLGALLEWAAVAQPASLDRATVATVASRAGSNGTVVLVCADPECKAQWLAAGGREDVVFDCAIEPQLDKVQPESVPTPIGRKFTLAIVASLVGGLVAAIASGALTEAGALLTAVAFSALATILMLSPLTWLSDRGRAAASFSLLSLAATLSIFFAYASNSDLGSSAVVALTGLGAAQAVRVGSRRDGLVMLALGPVMVIAVAGLVPGPALFLTGSFVALSALVGLAACDDPRSAQPKSSEPKTMTRSTILLATAAVALGAGAFLSLPLGGAALVGTASESDGRGRTLSAQVSRLATTAYFSGSMDLSSRGQLSPRAAFEVVPGTPGLLRAMTLDRVLNGVWSSDSGQREIVSRTGLIILRGDTAAGGAPKDSAVTLSIRPLDTAAVVTPGMPMIVSGLDAVRQVQSDAYVQVGAPKPYKISATPMDNIDNLRGLGVGPDQADPRFTTLDPTTTVRTQELGRSIVGGAKDRRSATLAVESWLRANVRYELNAPLPPQGQNAVDFLLFDSRSGFCEHFAAAETILLRSVGIPSRIATGYLVPSGSSSSRQSQVVRDSDAHAWVEVWIPGDGWVASDPTEGSRLADAREHQSGLDRALQLWAQIWSSEATRRVIAALVFAGLITGYFVRRWVGRPGRRSRRTSGPLTVDFPEPVAAYTRWREALASVGHDFCPSDGVSRARDAAIGDPELQNALDVVERTLYDRVGPSLEQRVLAGDQIDRRASAALVAAHGATGGPRS